MRPVSWLIIVLLALHLGQPGAAAADGGKLEELQYRLSLGMWQDVGRVHLRLTQEAPGRYRAEFAGAAQGVWTLLSRWLPERYETEMTLEGGRLRPVVFREEFQSKGRHIRKEYRFDYSRKVLELWRSEDSRAPEKRWQVPLKDSVYDPLSLFYNLRLGALGPVKGGETLRLALIPTPEPRELILRLGPQTSGGSTVVVEVQGKGCAETTPYFFSCTPQWVPQEAWTRVLAFGKLAGRLLNPGEIMAEGLPALSGRSPRLNEATPRN